MAMNPFFKSRKPSLQPGLMLMHNPGSEHALSADALRKSKRNILRKMALRFKAQASCWSTEIGGAG